MKKDDLIQVKIEDMGADGAGIGKMDGFALYKGCRYRRRSGS